PGASVRTAPVAAVVGGVAEREFDVVLADPPYAVTEESVTEALTALLANGWVGEGTVVVVERSSRSPETTWPDGMRPERVKRYGETRIEVATCYGLVS
ncbi:MAG: RsmD family RNA methyltransferase, partial [Nocardiaceae bacterium]|nr:RsmD family RNA methyltransferase [Nocardiaceae bacterium]